MAVAVEATTLADADVGSTTVGGMKGAVLEIKSFVKFSLRTFNDC